MNLCSRDYSILTPNEKELWEKLKEKEIVYDNEKPTMVRISEYKNYPKAARHFDSLFPNNFVDSIDLKSSKEIFEESLCKFELLLNDVQITERKILNFIKENNAWFIVASILKKNYHFGHHSVYLFPEFPLPPNYQADYLIVGKNSSGYHFVFVEFENPYKDITIKDGSFGTTIRKGIRQIDDWEYWIEHNYSNLKLVFDKQLNPNKHLPSEFLNFDKSRIHYVVVAGRRNDFSDKTYRLQRNHLDQRKLFVIHYDNLVDFSRDTIGTLTF